MKKTLSMLAAGAALSILGSAAASADEVLPGASCGLGATNNCLIFNDFNVYSLALLGLDVDSSPGKLQDDIVIATGASGAVGTNTDVIPSGLVDNAYLTPQGSGTDPSGNSLNFLMQAPDPTPSFTGDNAAQAQGTINDGPDGTLPFWDIGTNALKDYLAGEKMVFYFNLNQQNSDGGTFLSQGQDMLATLDVIFTNTTTGAQVKFSLNGNECGLVPGSCLPGIQNFNQTATTDILSTADDKWAYVHGQICKRADGTVDLGRCDAGDGPGATQINQNLGANEAAFALYSQGAQDALLSGNYNIMSVDLRMGALTNGYEQLFIRATTIGTTNVPEPSTIAITGAVLGFLGAGALWRRRKALKA